MQQKYLTITMLVTIIGIAFIFIPATYTIHLAPEQVTLWEDTTTGTTFNFNTGEQSITDGGVTPYVKVWSNELVTLNTTFHLTGMGEDILFNFTDNPSEILLPGVGEWSVEITGEVTEDTNVKVDAGFYYLRPLEPETITYYPYRYFGYGMTCIGIIASLFVYMKTKDEA